MIRSLCVRPLAQPSEPNKLQPNPNESYSWQRRRCSRGLKVEPVVLAVKVEAVLGVMANEAEFSAAALFPERGYCVIVSEWVEEVAAESCFHELSGGVVALELAQRSRPRLKDEVSFRYQRRPYLGNTTCVPKRRLLRATERCRAQRAGTRDACMPRRKK